MQYLRVISSGARSWRLRHTGTGGPNMFSFLSRCMKAPKGLQVVITLLCACIGLTASQNHTCRCSSENHRTSQSNCRFRDGETPQTRFEAAGSQNIGHTDSACDRVCRACLHSLTYKTVGSSSQGCAILGAKRARLPDMSFRGHIKQTDRLCSSPLRAPPSITS